MLLSLQEELEVSQDGHQPEVQPQVERLWRQRRHHLQGSTFQTGQLFFLSTIFFLYTRCIEGGNSTIRRYYCSLGGGLCQARQERAEMK